MHSHNTHTHTDQAPNTFSFVWAEPDTSWSKGVWLVSVWEGRLHPSYCAAAGNILMLDDRDQTSADTLMLIDFEYSSYNYR